jgi:hypothetical protein
MITAIGIMGMIGITTTVTTATATISNSGLTTTGLS